MGAFTRTEGLIGAGALRALENARVALFGAGGVGGFAAEALIRSGIGSITVIDADVIEQSNLNRQIIALNSNIGKKKTEELAARMADINPNARINCVNMFYLPENADELPLAGYDYVIDAVDTVSAKVEIIRRCHEAGVPVITCLGTAFKTDPSRLKVSAVEKTSVCPLARVMRRELKKLNISGVKAVWSDEPPYSSETADEKAVAPQANISGADMSLGTAPGAKENGVFSDGQKRQKSPPSMIFVPAAAGLMAAREAVFDIIRRKTK